MAPKKSTKSTKGSAQAYDKRKFINAQAEEHYKSSVITKTCIQERGFYNPGGQVEGMIEGRNWHYLTQQPEAALIPVIREFYANAKENPEEKVYVRGKKVNFNRATINDYYHLPSIDDDEYTKYLVGEPDYEDVISYLAEPGTTWKMSGDTYYNFPASGLNGISKAWHLFILAKLMPSSHTSHVTRERAILNYAIQKRYTIDIGNVIICFFKRCLQGSTTGGLPYPSLIYALCLSAGVETSAQEEIQHPKSALTKNVIHGFNRQRPKQHEAGMEEAPSERDTQMEEAPTQRDTRMEEASTSQAPPRTVNVENLSERIDVLSDQVRLIRLDQKRQLELQERGWRSLRRTEYMVDRILQVQRQNTEYERQFRSALTTTFNDWHLYNGPSGANFPQTPPDIPEQPYDPCWQIHDSDDEAEG